MDIKRLEHYLLKNDMHSYTSQIIRDIENGSLTVAFGLLTELKTQYFQKQHFLKFKFRRAKCITLIFIGLSEMYYCHEPIHNNCQLNYVK